jgi:hypothetical protein
MHCGLIYGEFADGTWMIKVRLLGRQTYRVAVANQTSNYCNSSCRKKRNDGQPWWKTSAKSTMTRINTIDVRDNVGFVCVCVRAAT